jgi:hypothetical protein
MAACNGTVFIKTKTVPSDYLLSVLYLLCATSDMTQVLGSGTKASPFSPSRYGKTASPVPI